MTGVLEQLVEATAKLPPEEQDALASRWLDELADDRKWDEAFSASQDVLEKLAAEVRKKI